MCVEVNLNYDNKTNILINKISSFDSMVTIMTEKNKPDDILIEKYRPSKLDEIIGQDEIVKRLKVYVSTRNMPHLLLSGPAGVGKTSASIALAKELYGETWQSNFLEINSSDERGIDVIRNRVKNYAAVSSIGEIKFKIIFLDEADALTNDAQSALRRTIERYTSSCRFVLSCNYSSKIITPIQSRTSVYRFKRIQPKDIIERCKYIVTQENIKVESEALEAIAYISEGDARKAIQVLDTARLTLTPDRNTITIKDIYQVSSYIEPKLITDIIKKALSREFFSSITLMENLIMDGISADDILKQLMTRAMELNLPHERMTIELVDIIGETDWRISEGANELIAFKHMIAKMVKLGSLI